MGMYGSRGGLSLAVPVRSASATSEPVRSPTAEWQVEIANESDGLTDSSTPNCNSTLLLRRENHPSD